MTPEEAVAIALAFAALEEAVRDGAVDPYDRPAWSTIHDPRTWTDFARREALQLDV